MLALCAGDSEVGLGGLAAAIASGNGSGAVGGTARRVPRASVCERWDEHAESADEDLPANDLVELGQLGASEAARDVRDAVVDEERHRGELR